MLDDAQSGLSWFGTLDDSVLQDTAASDTTPPDTHVGAGTFLRTYRAFLSARALLAIVMLLLLAGNWLIGNRTSAWVPVTLLYAATTLLLWLWPSQRKLRHPRQRKLSKRQALSTVGLDLLFFSVLQYVTISNVNTTALLVLPVLMAGILLPRLVSLGVAAAATINLLAEAWLQSTDLSSLTSMLTQTGLTGFGLFAIAALSSELSSRLANEERSARGSMELARQQAQLNRLVIEEMSEGVLVLDRQGCVRTANPAARRLLSSHAQTSAPPFQLRGVPAWIPLVQAIEQAMASPVQGEHGQELQLLFDDQTTRDLRIRTRFTRNQSSRSAEDMCVVWLEDLRLVRARQRQDKLAAMGRMSAGIAHEIRNPLAAIAQANALLAEDATDPTQARLTTMVKDNVNRLKHIVDDILAVSPGARPPAPVIDLIATTEQICLDWCRTQGLPASAEDVLHMDVCADRPHGEGTISVRFEPEHLQRVLINLLDNALRHGSQTQGAIEVRIQYMPAAIGHGLVVLSISSDGEPITAETERSLFEPFFSTRSRGSGLGLYISRELCERHGANIDYRLHPPPLRHRNEFFITMPIESNSSSLPSA
ncbi:sensor histidine kinase [Aquabacterium sp.]|uniref:sensor histidine kinase n=1 Tax=Aquabacterium sp. TaxID=1872578 RepID=UPI003B7421DA